MAPFLTLQTPPGRARRPAALRLTHRPRLAALHHPDDVHHAARLRRLHIGNALELRPPGVSQCNNGLGPWGGGDKGRADGAEGKRAGGRASRRLASSNRGQHAGIKALLLSEAALRAHTHRRGGSGRGGALQHPAPSPPPEAPTHPQWRALLRPGSPAPAARAVAGPGHPKPPPLPRSLQTPQSLPTLQRSKAAGADSR